MSDVTYRLKHPVEYGSQTIEELTLREMEFGDIENWNPDSNRSMKVLIELISVLSGQPPSVIKRLKIVDTEGVLNIIKKDMPAGLSIGTKP